jgi:mono/diheme cytochrome c family protein
MRTRLLFFSILVAALFGCAEEEYPFSPAAAGDTDASGAPVSIKKESDASVATPGKCTQASAGQSLPQRLVTMKSTSDAGADAEAGAGSADAVFLVSDLWQMYETSCGGPCHDHGAPGGFSIPHVTDFPSNMTKTVLAHIMSDGPTAGVSPLSDPKDPMPPFSDGGKPFSQRGPTDAIVRFATLIQDWLSQNSPADSFTVASTPSASMSDMSAASASFVLSQATADSMTLIGNCIPSMPLVVTQSTRIAQLDDMFTKAMAAPNGSTAEDQLGLPPQLSQTDLFTLDSAVLAQYGVIGYAPTYPLWSDNAANGTQTGKLRYIRVPHGQSVQFDKATQKFTIPPNTRFYKTFMKKIVDVDGSIRFRKIETRLIVSRPDVTNSDQSVTPTALFGTYKWREDETDADLEQNPLNNGHFFADDLFTYVEDEQLSPIIRAENPGNADEAEIYAGSRKHYAIPSSQRCVECHEGSPSDSFVLGFTPVQINRRPVGQGGVIEPAGPDDLTQLKRLINYGVITGVASAADVLPLEQLEGSRTPRNDQELIAQGYMVGNCAHCHNPHGFPSVTYPVLSGVLNFLPGPTSGIFQFPLEKFSPRIFRGPSQTVQIPYITPSLLDLPPFVAADGTPEDPSYGLKIGTAGGLNYVLFAPWRSLIFRNVNTPFTYTDDFALFPHMPMNTPGYDPNASRIMADWMVSIPAIRKNPQTAEYDLTNVDNSTQPYVEVKPGAPNYNDAVSAAQSRLAVMHAGANAALNPPPSNQSSYYSYSPDTSDIRDPLVEVSTCQTVPAAGSGDTATPLGRAGQANVPDHAHWVITDLSEPQGPWGPRRADWYSVLIPPASGSDAGVDEAGVGIVQVQTSCSDNNAAASAARAHEQQVAVDVLQGVTLDKNFETFATTPQPFGLWQSNPACTFPGVPKASTFTGPSRPQWMDNPAADVSPNSPVYELWPGQAVFNMICINCHGPKADGTGRLADNLLTMTGGTVRVADLRDGIFGQSGMNRPPVFGDATLLSADNVHVSNFPNWSSTAVDDRAARYLAWMGLGGTTANIPLSILNIVADTSVLGVHRSLPSSAISANMLSAAKALCQSVLAGDPGDAFKVDTGTDSNGTALTHGGSTLENGTGDYAYEVKPNWFDPDSRGSAGVYENLNHSLITSNGDAELWLRLCSVDNPPPVRVAVEASAKSNYVRVFASLDDALIEHLWSPDFVRPDIYGNSPVGNDRGTVDAQGITGCTDMTTPCNLRPWCVPGATDPAVPACPSQVAAAAPTETQLVGTGTKCADGSTNCWTADDADRWATRGAINAGLAVFVYLDHLAKGTAFSQPDYTQCPLPQ